MFDVRFNQIMATIGSKSNREFARFCDYDTSYVSRMSRGERIPKRGGDSSERLVRNIHSYALEKNRLGELGQLIGISPQLPNKEFCVKLQDWLYEGESGVTHGSFSERKDVDELLLEAPFCKRLDAAMELADMSNIRLAKLINVNASLIVKYRSGVRTPQNNHPIVTKISNILFERICLLNHTYGLARLTGIPKAKIDDQKNGGVLFEKWLRNADSEKLDTSLIESFLESIDSFSPDTELPLFSPEEAVGEALMRDTSEIYEGIDGLRRAVLRFLCNAAKSHGKELWLYSDQSTDWMTEDRVFTRKWMSLMSVCVRNGTRIKIVHNIDRGIDEMLAAIGNWMPLYMSGMIESYYCTGQSNGPISHTMFLSPESECVCSICIGGHEQNATYFYVTEQKKLELCKKLYNDLLAECHPLIEMELPERTTLLSVPRKSKSQDTYVVQNVFTLATMPESLLHKMLARSKLPKQTQQEIIAEWEVRREYLQSKLRRSKSTFIRECIPLPDDESLYEGRVLADITQAQIDYTPEELAEHAQHIIELMECFRNYRIAVLPETPFARISFLATESYVLVRRLTAPAIAFTITHPMLCAAFVAYAERLCLQYGVDLKSSRERLKRVT